MYVPLLTISYYVSKELILEFLGNKSLYSHQITGEEGNRLALQRLLL